MKGLSFFSLLLICGSLFAQNVSLDQALQTSTQAVITRLPQGSKVAVLSFTSASQSFSDYVIDEIATNISTGNRIQVIERQYLDAVRRELNIQMSGDGRYMECSGELGSFGWNQAITAAQNYDGGGFSDWRLPTKDELNLMYVNLKVRNLGGFGNDWYWSSSQYNNGTGWVQRFSDGNQGDNFNMNPTALVRAIRAF